MFYYFDKLLLSLCPPPYDSSLKNYNIINIRIFFLFFLLLFFALLILILYKNNSLKFEE